MGGKSGEKGKVGKEQSSGNRKIVVHFNYKSEVKRRRARKMAATTDTE